eukprot:GILJ01005101.1.p1 GENE.GILJ01005101.1~~GILJ01005101.1.p1  ORF type:complete len:174 (-),score=36.51 GILJ01005101.1:247-768(-)
MSLVANYGSSSEEEEEQEVTSKMVVDTKPTTKSVEPSVAKPTPPTTKLPSAAALLAKVPEKFLDEGAESNEEEEFVHDKRGTKYNQVAPPSTTLSMSNKGEAGFIPKPANSSSTVGHRRPFESTESASHEVKASPSGGPSRSAALIPPQLRGRPNANTEDTKDLFVKKQKLKD